MRLVIQRVEEAQVTVDDLCVGKIDRGFLVLVGITHEDTEQTAQKLAKKMLGLRIFPDAEGKTNLSLQDVAGSLLLVSQFTLYADCRKGYRPSFTQAAEPQRARELFDYFTRLCREAGARVETGCFGAHMKVGLTNDGPFTILLDAE